jgi:hypothetical protein
MATRKKHADRFSERADSIDGAEVFQAGIHRGKEYTQKDLDEMVDNFNKFSTGKKPLMHIPVVLGHEEDQTFLERSDLPAAGWVTRLYRDGNTLKADIGEVAKPISDLVKTHRYRTISSEIYDEPPSEVPGKGKMVRRIAFLGADQPQLKGIADIPMPSAHREQFASGQPTFLRFHDVKPTPGVPGCYSCFAEVTAMDPTQLLQQLQDMGFDVSAFQQLPPETLQAIIDGAQAMQAAQNTDTAAQPDPNAAPPNPDDPKGFSDAFAFDDGDLPDAADAAMAEKFKASAQKFAARAMKMMEKYCGIDPADPAARNSDSPIIKTDTAGVMADAPADPVGIMTPPAVPPTPPKKVTMTHQYAEEFKKALDAAKAEIKAEFAGVKAQTDALEANTRRASITAFCEAMRDKGILIPAQLDSGDPKNPRPTVIDRLFAANHSQKVHKFRENGKDVPCTELELQMKEIETGPVLKRYGESVIKSGSTTAAAGEEEKEKVKEHFEQFRERFERAGVTQEGYLKAFESQRKTNRELTAEKYTNMGRKAG